MWAGQELWGLKLRLQLLSLTASTKLPGQQPHQKAFPTTRYSSAQMDPFGLRPHATNSALSKQHTLAADIYEHLFDRIFFKSKEYASWSQGDRPWSLNIYGAPGCGKVRCVSRLQDDES